MIKAIIIFSILMCCICITLSFCLVYWLYNEYKVKRK